MKQKVRSDYDSKKSLWRHEVKRGEMKKRKGDVQRRGQQRRARLRLVRPRLGGRRGRNVWTKNHLLP